MCQTCRRRNSGKLSYRRKYEISQIAFTDAKAHDSGAVEAIQDHFAMHGWKRFGPHRLFQAVRAVVRCPPPKWEKQVLEHSAWHTGGTKTADYKHITVDFESQDDLVITTRHIYWDCHFANDFEGLLENLGFHEEAMRVRLFKQKHEETEGFNREAWRRGAAVERPPPRKEPYPMLKGRGRGRGRGGMFSNTVPFPSNHNRSAGDKASPPRSSSWASSSSNGGERKYRSQRRGNWRSNAFDYPRSTGGRGYRIGKTTAEDLRLKSSWWRGGQGAGLSEDQAAPSNGANTDASPLERKLESLNLSDEPGTVDSDPHLVPGSARVAQEAAELPSAPPPARVAIRLAPLMRLSSPRVRQRKSSAPGDSSGLGDPSVANSYRTPRQQMEQLQAGNGWDGSRTV